MENKTHWKKLVNPVYLGVYSLPNEQDDLTVTILSVAREQVISEGGKKEECTVAQIKNNKPLILNRTNCKTIAKLYDSPYIEDWAGKQVTLFASTTKLKGDIVECLRIRPIVTIPAKPKLPDERFKSAMIALKEGTVTALKLRTSYDLTQEQLDKIKEVEDAKNTM